MDSTRPRLDAGVPSAIRRLGRLKPRLQQRHRPYHRKGNLRKGWLPMPDDSQAAGHGDRSTPASVTPLAAPPDSLTTPTSLANALAPGVAKIAQALERRLDINPPAPIDRSHRDPNATLGSLASLPAWQRRIVALVQRGVPIRDACEQQRVSWASLDTWTRRDARFAAAIANAEAGVAIAGVDSVRSLAVAHAEDMVLDAVEESRGRGVDGAPVLPRDRVSNRRLVLETAGAVGSGAPPGGVTVQGVTAGQIAILVQQAQARAPSPAPPPG